MNLEWIDSPYMIIDLFHLVIGALLAVMDSFPSMIDFS